MSSVYPTSATLKLVAQDKLSLLTRDDPAFELFPPTTEDVAELQWEIRGNVVGLQSVRGVNGQPGVVKPLGANRFKAEPGEYGDVWLLDEKAVKERRKLGTFGDAVDLTDLVYEGQDQLLAREIDRLRVMIWTLLQQGVFSFVNAIGNVVHTDAYPLQQAVGSNWSNLAGATPLQDMRATKLLHRGHSVKFDRTATAYANTTTINYLLNNTNAADLYGKRQDVGATFNSLADINKIFSANDLPQFAEYDETYFTDAAPTVPVTFLTDRKVVIVGKRKDGSPVGDVCAIRNANNPKCEPGSYDYVADSLERGMAPVPRQISVHRGWSGGIRLYYPSACISLTV